MPTGKNTPFNFTLIGMLLCLLLFSSDSHLHAASVTSPLFTHFTCHFFHANIFHLAGNVLCLSILRPSPAFLLRAFPVAVAATWFTDVPSIGFSAVLYAYMGLNALGWRIGAKDWLIFITANLLTAFLPGIAFTLHLMAFSFGMIVSLVLWAFRVEGR